MKKHIILTIVVLCIILNSVAQDKRQWDKIEQYYKGVAPACVGDPDENGLWGLVDENGNTIVEPQYNYRFHFREGLARVVKNHRIGYIDTAGNVIVPLKYSGGDYNHGFLNGFAVVRHGDLFGYVNNHGREIIPPEYSFAKPFNEYGYAVVYHDMGWESSGGYSFPRANEQTKCAIVDTLGNEIIKKGKYKNIDFGAGNGYFIVQQEDKKYGVIDVNNTTIIPFNIYDGIDAYFDKYYKVHKNKKYGVCDVNGKIVVPLKYDNVSILYYDNKIAFCLRIYQSYQNQTYEWMSETGKIKPIKYESAGGYISHSMIKCNRAMVQYKGKWGWINIDGEEVIPCKYDHANSDDFYLSMTAIVGNLVNGKYKYGVIDVNGQIILPLIYDAVNIYKRDGEEHIHVKLNDRQFAVDRTGKKIKDLE